MKITGSITGVVALLAAGQVLAQDIDGAGPSGPVSGIEDALRIAGLDASWGATTGATGGPVLISDLEITGDGWVMLADEARYAGSAVDLLDVVILGQDGGDGEIRAERIALSGPGGFATIDRLLGGAGSGEGMGACAPSLPEDQTVFFRNLVLEGDTDALPASARGAETIRVSMMETVERMAENDDACDVTRISTAMDVGIVAIDGSRLAVGDLVLEQQARTAEGDRSATAHSIDMRDISIADATGIVSARAGHVQMRTEVDAALSSLDPRELDPADIVDRLSRTTSAQTAIVEDLFIDVPAFFPSYMVTALGLGDTPEISGGAALRADISKGIADVSVDIDMPALARLKSRTRLGLPDTLEATLPAFVADKIPVPGAVLDVDVYALELDWEDRGAGRIVEAVSGKPPVAHFDRAAELGRARVEDKLPAFLAAKLDEVTGFLSNLVEEGGRVALEPEEPMSVMTLVVQGMMNPKGLTGTLGMEAELHK